MAKNSTQCCKKATVAKWYVLVEKWSEHWGKTKSSRKTPMTAEILKSGSQRSLLDKVPDPPTRKACYLHTMGHMLAPLVLLESPRWLTFLFLLIRCWALDKRCLVQMVSPARCVPQITSTAASFFGQAIGSEKNAVLGIVQKFIIVCGRAGGGGLQFCNQP